MTKREAQRLAKKIDKSKTNCITTGLRLYTYGQHRSWAIDAQNLYTGDTFIVNDRADWAMRTRVGDLY